jgi:hypothetical protein
VNDIILRPGDIFCTENPMAIGRAINAVQAFWDPDGESKYSHSGIIISETGETSEALWTIKKSNIDQYAGKPIIIGRHRDMTLKLFRQAYGRIESQEGAWYPLWRLPLHLFPPLAKYICFTSMPVCSEWTSKFLQAAGIFHDWSGKTPDYLADMIIRWRWWDVVYEGIWEKNR